jgi:hypothetical protein
MQRHKRIDTFNTIKGTSKSAAKPKKRAFSADPARISGATWRKTLCRCGRRVAACGTYHASDLERLDLTWGSSGEATRP